MATESSSEFLEAVPLLPQSPSSDGTSTKAIKVATPDIILFDEEGFPVDMMVSLIFEQIGGQEIINIARNDIINGQRISYSLISNADQVNNAHNTRNIFSISGTLDSFFKNFGIRLEIHIPERGTGPSGELVYVDQTGSLVVDVTRMGVNQQVEIQVLSAGQVISDILEVAEES
jgi:hypothetical protein